MNNKMKSVLAALVAACGMGAAQAAPLRVQVPAQYEDNAPVVDRVREECAVESLLGNHVFGKISQRYRDALQVSDPAQLNRGRVLKLTILSVQGVGGGGWSGAKAITVRGDLLQDGQVVRSTVLRQNSRGGVFGGMRGTCSILETVAESLGKQMAAWVATMEGAQSVPAATAPVATSASEAANAAANAAVTEAVTGAVSAQPSVPQSSLDSPPSGSPAQSAP